MDLGDFGGEAEFDLYNGATRVRTLTLPTKTDLEKRGGGFLGYINGNTPFNRVVFKLRQFTGNPSRYDYIGYDDLIVGQCISCVPSALPVVHYGINTVATAAKTVDGPAKTARDAFVAAAGSLYVCNFEDDTFAFPGSGLTTSIGLNLHTTTTASNQNIAASDAGAGIKNDPAAARWNTTSGGTKWIEFKDEFIISFTRPGEPSLSAAIRSFGFYITDLGQQNATLRVTFRRRNIPWVINSPGGASADPAVVYYVPKAAELASPNGLLRFWGVVNEEPFHEVVIQVVYYSDLTPNTYTTLPAWLTASPIETVGIDDILIG